MAFSTTQWPTASNFPSDAGDPLTNVPRRESGALGSLGSNYALTYNDSDVGVDTGAAHVHSGVLIPKVWSMMLNYKFYASTVLNYIVNTRWEGELQNQGDSVIIRKTGDTHIFDVGSAYDTVKYQLFSATQRTLTINKGKGVAFASDDILKRQSDFDFISEFFDNAAIQLALNIDLQVLNNIPGHVNTSNQGNTAGAKSGTFTLGTAAQPLNINRANVNRLLAAMTGVLGEQNIPCLLYTSPSPRDRQKSRMPSSA